MSPDVFCREVEVVAAFGFECGVAFHYPYPAHVEVVVTFFQRRRAESHAVAGAQGEMRCGSEAQRELGCQPAVVGVREMVVAQCGDGLKDVRRLPVVLCEGVEAVLPACVAFEFVVEEIVVHDACSDRQCVSPACGVGI